MSSVMSSVSSESIRRTNRSDDASIACSAAAALSQRTPPPTPLMQQIVARLKPWLGTPKAGRVYYWCRCGRSANQPFCDGSHKGTGFEPMQYVTLADGEEVLLCGCKQTRPPPVWDGRDTQHTPRPRS